MLLDENKELTTTLNLQLTQSAIEHFKHLIDLEDDDDLNLRLTIDYPGTARADLGIVFCPQGQQESSDVAVEYPSFTLFVDIDSVPFLKDAVIDYKQDTFGGELAVKAPFIRGKLAEDADLHTQIEFLIDNEINPNLAAHGGFIKLIQVTENIEVIIQFGGGCQGCGMADVTLKSGIEKSLKDAFPQITKVLDVTDHTSGTNPYY